MDDFIGFGNCTPVTQEQIRVFRTVFNTTEPIWDPEVVLGLELTRDRVRKTIQVRMSAKILEVCARFQVDSTCRQRTTPMPCSGYIIQETDYDNLEASASRFLNRAERSEYMGIVGALIWISGVRFDVNFATLYLSWHTKQPRAHHYTMATRVLHYLFHSADIPLVLGGALPVDMIASTDASLATGPKGRSIIARVLQLNSQSGSILAKCSSTSLVHGSSFEAELDGVYSTAKMLKAVQHLVSELNIPMSTVPTILSDNLPTVEYVQGNNLPKAVRHMQMRIWYLRERYHISDYKIQHLIGTSIIPDQMTKIGSSDQFLRFRSQVLGLSLLDV